MKKRTIEEKIVTRVHGNYQWLVIDGDEVVKTSSGHNHIFGSGLDYVNDLVWADCFQWCRLGDFTDPTGSTGDYESVYGAAFQSPILGGLGVAGPTDFFTGFIVAPYSFSGCNTSGLFGENGTETGIVMRRTWDFAENPVGETGETPDVIYTEVGWAPYETSPLFSRTLTHSGDPTEHSPIVLQEGQFLRVIYELSVAYDSGHQFYTGSVITGYTGVSSGHAGIQSLGLSSVDSEGLTTFYDDTSGANEPSVVAWGFLSDNETELAPIGSDVDRSVAESGYHENRCHHFTYTSGSYTKTKRFFVSGDFADYTGWKSMGLGVAQSDALTESGFTAANNNYVYIFDEGFNKEQDFVLNVLFRYSWSGVD